MTSNIQFKPDRIYPVSYTHLDVYKRQPLECWGYSKEEINKKVDELLRLVGLENKAKNKPKHLSGGQKLSLIHI